MQQKIASWLFLFTGVFIGLGAFGHGLGGIKHVDVELAKFPAFDPNVLTMLYVVWYFVSGCMLAFGSILAWTWWRYRRGERKIFFASDVIAVLYIVTGVAAMAYRHGDPFFAMFVALGVLLGVSSWVLRRSK